MILVFRQNLFCKPVFQYQQVAHTPSVSAGDIVEIVLHDGEALFLHNKHVFHSAVLKKNDQFLHDVRFAAVLYGEGQSVRVSVSTNSKLVQIVYSFHSGRDAGRRACRSGIRVVDP